MSADSTTVVFPHARRRRRLLPGAALKHYFEAVWDEVIVEICGERPDPVKRVVFVDAHMDPRCPTKEYRISGHLGFGGKYRSRAPEDDSVDCYSEDATPERQEIIRRAKEKLKEVRARFASSASHQE